MIVQSRGLWSTSISATSITCHDFLSDQPAHITLSRLQQQNIANKTRNQNKVPKTRYQKVLIF